MRRRNGREVKYGDDLAELEARRYSGTLALRFSKSSKAIHREGSRKVGSTFHKSVWAKQANTVRS
jgi:hypothetical protein